MTWREVYPPRSGEGPNSRITEGWEPKDLID